MARKTANKQKPFQETLKEIIESENATYEKVGITRLFVVTFPNRQKPPLLGRLAVKLLEKSGGIIQMQYLKRDKQ
jgi:hypothetical protein